ncbi:GTP pyrophosphokinase [Streptomyces sp. 2224.1]|uniref:RelA/SpoT family protein n=1 Tax=unclassified Streptomyces TaxID=2593676 RepID=UPI00088B5F9A|nr:MULTISPECIES: HD domain-containing protein [unclassified Streptomyces]PBC85471.1 GTP pyrophosphokinase [Streptomyces sp. 2321.6]SDR14237.1 GTP pyrophosphokinase [Streptomyces sp. KS_16]SED69110.1 GTP pyrophosphokinase [Streptomyces sp. 2133.1]SEE33304.1 GTP pyrophosphokinase [Streptomyces sp. 2224.1]SNC71850.1 GTP pyrophosphokinase [Streptomyces sp. 2114.4]
MSAEATNPGNPGAAGRKRGRRRLELRDLRRIGRAALLGPAPRDGLPHALEHVAKVHRGHHPDADLDTLTRAYLLAESSHRGQLRKSGEPYITHPLAVTLILAELGAETTTLTASLLHDTVEDTEVTLDQVRERFGAEVCYLVDGVTKLEKVDYGAAAEPETFRKMLVATGNDVRVMSIKLADRLHNMRTLGVMRPEKQARIAKVTRDVLIPLAERLGVQALKAELEDLVFAILHPEEYATTRALVMEYATRPDPLTALAQRVRTVLAEAGIDAEVLVRPRHFVSVHRVRLARRELTGADLGRLLVLVAEDADCYAVLGELHTCFTPVVSEFKDFIAAPKFNLYQSLHTAVAGPSGEIAETLIRTHQMHRVAEAGVIALGNPYAPTDGVDAPEGERADPTRPGWLSRLLEWQRITPDPDTFWTSLRDDLAQDREITVFCTDAPSGGSPALPGGAIGLPAGASCVDAAYERHGEVAHCCIGARVNGRLATLSTVLHDGDSLQLLMAPDSAAGPSPEWLDHARTPAARLAIARWLAGPQEPGARPAGAGEGPVAAPPADRRAADDDRPGAAPVAASVLVVADLPGAAVRLAGCCTPVPPDTVTGFAVRGGTVTVHRALCPAVARMAATGRQPVGVRWRGAGQGGHGCRVTLLAEAFSRPQLLADLTEAIASQGAAVVSAAVEPPREQRVRHTYTLHLPNAAGLPSLMRAMRQVPGVFDVLRAGRSRPAALRP